MKGNNLITLDSKEGIGIYDVFDYEGCKKIKESTSARVCVGRCGPRYRTETLLRFRASHASAMNAVCSSEDETVYECLGFLKVQTMAETKEDYISSPNLGAMLYEDTINFVKNVCIAAPDVQVIIAESFNSPAVTRNIRELYSIIHDGIKSKRYKTGDPVLVKYGKKAALDSLCEIINAKITILIVSEELGISSSGNIVCFIIHNKTQKSGFEKLIISNLHNSGISAAEAGRQVVNKINTVMKEELKL